MPTHHRPRQGGCIFGAIPTAVATSFAIAIAAGVAVTGAPDNVGAVHVEATWVLATDAARRGCVAAICLVAAGRVLDLCAVVCS